jgi:putative oxidoreductase
VKYLILAARFLIGGLFVYASVYKIGDPGEFSAAVRNYLLLPLAWSNLLALTLPWVELVAGMFLILGIQTRPSAVLTTAMLLAFFVAISYAYWTGLDIDCGCFGSPAESKGRVGMYYLLRDAALVLTSLFILVCDRGDMSMESMCAFRNGSTPA